MTQSGDSRATARGSGKLLFWSWFNTLPFRQARETDAWTEERFRFWLAYTLRSVLGQREGDWRYWLVCARELRHLTDPLRAAITDPRVELVFDDECCDRLALLPSADRYLLARLDSDDLYHPITASTLLKQRPRTTFLQFNRGFALDVRSGEVLAWHSRSSPFYTHVYGEEIRRLDVWAEPNHTTVARSATILGSGHFLVSLHGANTSTTRAHASGGPFPAERSSAIVGQFGVGGDRPLDDLLTTARVPTDWDRRWRELGEQLSPLLDELSRWIETPPLSAMQLLVLACELSGGRRALVIDDLAGAVVVRSTTCASCELVVDTGRNLERVRRRLPRLVPLMEATHDPPESGRYDVAFVDLRRAAPDLRSVRSALAAVNEMGLVVIAGVDAEQHGDRLRQGLSGTIVDRYVEVDTMTRDSSGSTCWLLGRPLVT